MLRAFTASPALRAAAAFGVGGFAFALSNLVLARIMSPEQYGLVSLVIGIVSVSSLAAPLGLDLSIARRGIPLEGRLRRSALIASFCMSLITTLAATLVYSLPASLLLCVFLSTGAGGITQTVAAHFQGQRRFSLAVPFLQISNLALVPVAGVTALLHEDRAVAPSGITAAIVFVTAVCGWQLTARETKNIDASRNGYTDLWKEALTLVTIHAASAFFLQLERLVIPLSLGVDNLAIYGVLAALVGSPFRMIQAAVMFTVVPRLQAVRTAEARRELLLREFVLIGIVMLFASAAIWFIAPRIADWFLAGRYSLSASLLAATLVGGVLKVLSAFCTATVTALAPQKHLRALSIGSWGSIALGALVAMLFARWGLSALLYGISIGWLARCLISLYIAIPYLRDATMAQPATLN